MATNAAKVRAERGSALIGMRDGQRSAYLSATYGDAASPAHRDSVCSTLHAEMRPPRYTVYMHPYSFHGLDDKRRLDLTPLGPCQYCGEEFAHARVPAVVAYDYRTRTYTLASNFCSLSHAIGHLQEHRTHATPMRIVWQFKLAEEVLCIDLETYTTPIPRMCYRKNGGHVDPRTEAEYLAAHTVRVVEGAFVSHASMVEASVYGQGPIAEDPSPPPRAGVDQDENHEGGHRVWNVRGMRAPAASASKSTSGATDFPSMVRDTADLNAGTARGIGNRNYAESDDDGDARPLFERFVETTEEHPSQAVVAPAKRSRAKKAAAPAKRPASDDSASAPKRKKAKAVASADLTASH